ncbi:hypothetical protein F5880DRAFT_1581268 [Lentinula raphanica]|nr:hypothetical protein F5880DRAFT_1581268 [Lentinula raphanica]
MMETENSSFVPRYLSVIPSPLHLILSDIPLLHVRLLNHVVCWTLTRLFDFQVSISAVSVLNEALFIMLALSISVSCISVKALRVQLQREIATEALVAPVRLAGRFLFDHDDPDKINFNVVNMSNPFRQVIQTEIFTSSDYLGSFPVPLDEPGSYQIHAQEPGSNYILAMSNTILVAAPDETDGSDGDSNSDSFSQTDLSTSSTFLNLSSTSSSESTTSSLMQAWPSNVVWSFTSVATTTTPSSSGASSQPVLPTPSSVQSSNSTSEAKTRRTETLIGGIIGGVVGLLLLIILAYYGVHYVRRKRDLVVRGFWDGGGPITIAERRRPWYAIMDVACRPKPSQTIIPFTQMTPNTPSGLFSEQDLVITKPMQAHNVTPASSTETFANLNVPSPNGSDNEQGGFRPAQRLKPLMTGGAILDISNPNGQSTSSLVVNITSATPVTQTADRHLFGPISHQSTPPPSYRSSSILLGPHVG